MRVKHSYRGLCSDDAFSSWSAMENCVVNTVILGVVLACVVELCLCDACGKLWRFVEE